MPRALFHSSNLIGDALNISPALRSWYEDHKDWEIFMQTMDDQTAKIYTKMGVPLWLTEETSVWKEIKGEPDFEFTFDVGKAFQIGHEKQCHIAEAYSVMLDVPIDTLKPTYIPEEEEHEKDLILLSIFSKSCSVHETGIPNKTLPWQKMEPILEYLRTLGRIGVLGSPNDRSPLPLSEEEYYTGLPLNKVALMLRDAKLLITIDNGMAHLAASQETPLVVFYPACLSPKWIAPLGNPNAKIVQVDPVKVAAGLLLRRTKELVYELLKGGRGVT